MELGRSAANQAWSVPSTARLRTPPRAAFHQAAAAATRCNHRAARPSRNQALLLSRRTRGLEPTLGIGAPSEARRASSRTRLAAPLGVAANRRRLFERQGYATTKHAVVGLATWVAITCHDSGNLDLPPRAARCAHTDLVADGQVTGSRRMPGPLAFVSPQYSGRRRYPTRGRSTATGRPCAILRRWIDRMWVSSS